MNETRGTLGVVGAPTDADFFRLNDLPNDVLVSVFIAVEDPTWVRHTFPLVCRAWNELYLTKGASPLHETLEVDFDKEIERAKQERRRRVGRPLTGAATQDLASYRTFFYTSRVLAWAQGRADSVRKLQIKTDWMKSHFGDFFSNDLDALVAVVGPSLTELVLDCACTSLPRFPESFLALTKLRRLVLDSHVLIKEIPAGISSLKKLEELELRNCGLLSLPKELSELSGLTKLNLKGNINLEASLPAAEAFPAELGKMKSLRELDLGVCYIDFVPAFVGELEALEVLDLSGINDLQIDAPLDFLLEGCPRLRLVNFGGRLARNAESLAHLEAFAEKLRAKNPSARVYY